MPRKLRLEYAGAIQHVINRGNYRLDIFADERAKGAFEACLFETCEKSRWILHAFTIMRNHFHLSLETPEPNLIEGMQWLQGTFAVRFNRFRNERGHLFQGRYKAILTEEGKSLGEVCDYIHLNPIKAGIVPLERLQEYRYSSYWYLHQPRRRPSFLRVQTGLECAGGLPDSPHGWMRYAERLKLQLAQTIGPGKWEERQRALCHGWAIGSQEFKRNLVEEFQLTGQLRSSDATGVKEVRSLGWMAALNQGLEALGYSLEEARSTPKSLPWKLALAAWMKKRTQANNPWLTEQLNLGTPNAFSRNLTNFRRARQGSDPTWRMLTSLSGA
jgi:REP element-mobilizing transposase RayT